MGVFLGAVLISGCASSTPRFEMPEPRPIGREFPTAVAREDPGTRESEFQGPKGSITMNDALAAALKNSPQLAAFSWEMRAREAEALQAGLLPNPELTGEVENVAGTGDVSGFSASETTIGFSQLFEMGGKRAKRLALAGRNHDLAAWDYEAARIVVLTRVRKAFINVLALQKERDLAENLVGVAESVFESVSRRVKAGAVSPVEESRALVELETSRIDRDQVVRELAIAVRRLAATWGETSPSKLTAEGDLESLTAAPPLEVLTGRIEQNPDIARWAAEIDRRRAAVELARAEGVPDLTIGAGVRRLAETDDTGFIFEVGLPLPLFDRNQGRSRAAGARLRRAEEEERDTRIRILTEISSIHAQLLAARSEVTALTKRILPRADEAFLTARDAYQRGLMRFTDVLDTRRALFELRARYFRALVRYHHAKADLEQLVGESLETLTQTGRP